MTNSNLSNSTVAHLIAFITYIYAPLCCSFQLNPPFRVDEIVFDDEISCGDEIRLDGGWVDLISSAEQISSEQCEDFIVRSTISLKYKKIAIQSFQILISLM